MPKTKQSATLVADKLTGLTTAQAATKLKQQGLNLLPSSKPKSFLHIALSVIKEPMFILLVACGSLYLVLGNLKEGTILFCFVFVIMAIEFFQERKTEKALDALKWRKSATYKPFLLKKSVQKPRSHPGRKAI